MRTMKKMALAVACVGVAVMALPAMASAVTMWSASAPGVALPIGTTLKANNDSATDLRIEDQPHVGGIACYSVATTGTLTQNGKKSGGTVTVENMTGTASSCHETTYGYSVTVTDFSIDKITTSVFGTGDIGLSLTVKVGPVTCEYSGEGSFSSVGTNTEVPYDLRAPSPRPLCEEAEESREGVRIRGKFDLTLPWASQIRFSSVNL